MSAKVLTLDKPVTWTCPFCPTSDTERTVPAAYDALKAHALMVHPKQSALVQSIPRTLTTDATLQRDLERSLEHMQTVRGIDVGETWGTFCAAMVKLGITPETPLLSIEYGVSALPTGRIVKDLDERGGVEIRETAYGS